MTTHKEALTALVHEMEYVLSCINADKVPFDGDDFHEALRLGKEALSSPNGEAQPEQKHFTWAGLTDEEILEEIPVVGHRPITSFARAIEAKLKAKNERLENNT